jgi:hypothetical protein
MGSFEEGVVLVAGEESTIAFCFSCCSGSEE